MTLQEFLNTALVQYNDQDLLNWETSKDLRVHAMPRGSSVAL